MCSSQHLLSHALTRHLACEGFPTIKLFRPGKDRPIDYNGPRDESDLVAFAMDEWSKSRPPPEILQLVGSDVWKEQCMGHQLCLVSFLPHILDSKADGRQKYLKMLKGVAKAYKDRPFSWFWSEGGAQPELEEALAVSYGYPAFVAVAPEKNKYSSLKSGFSEDSLREFVDNVRRGQETVSSTTKSIGEVTITRLDGWDGKDAVEEFEEEFSLEDLGL